ncbi:uncharacterized protein L969DRAFT_87550 [Mixia osmundae IAM 14324]|uniref:Uncharacterized protein n=1 Tax=Mixia osmundae (strain CBS 9802 / IAM 14324 / JCM 22182 / KY 12970) TaxID=764103 RepID=G7DVW5_MIXOS|nr:uncharacterized protein L969DRAFT_87550 [Mixia osmundae IAM 14324]KEI39595.1 hypothetical protein L969DRAFT_87550 [Mixia osmundae IAM 14324]GAA94725.1 hypothetical protein E5Q_01378 [Mixia osmundae IAM 14324]
MTDKARAQVDDSLGSRIAASARSLASDVTASSSATTSSTATNGAWSSDKPPPSALNDRQALHGAQEHAQLGSSISYVQSSGPRPFAKLRHTNDEQDYAGSDIDYAAFASPAVPHYTQPEPLRTIEPAAYYSSRDYRPEDLRIRPGDGAAVLALLESETFDDDTQAEHTNADLDNPRGADVQSWRKQLDEAVPDDPLLDLTRDELDALRLQRDANPYLFELLSGDRSIDSRKRPPRDIQEYLALHTYTDDVYGLPDSIKRTLDEAKDSDASDETRNKALRRLEMLRRHLFATSSPTDAI